MKSEMSRGHQRRYLRSRRASGHHNKLLFFTCGVDVCNDAVYHHNKPWVSFAAAVDHYRPVVDDVFELGYTLSFEVRQTPMGRNGGFLLQSSPSSHRRILGLERFVTRMILGGRLIVLHNPAVEWQ